LIFIRKPALTLVFFAGERCNGEELQHSDSLQDLTNSTKKIDQHTSSHNKLQKLIAVANAGFALSD
jgi:UTP:GlnB (protein PII) uridylyltransferase